jgi:hypothetical protein
MSFEGPVPKEGISLPLETFFRRMGEENQLIIENDIFNSADSIPLSTVFTTITDVEEARTMMTAFSRYLKDREFLSKEQRLLRAEEINEYIDRRL